MKPARYFPVVPGALRLRAGLVRFGADFGNGPLDRRFFQIDCEREHYLRARHAAGRHGAAAPVGRCGVLRGPEHREAHAAVLGWMRATLAREAPQLLRAERTEAAEPGDAIARLVLQLQEDLVVVRRTAAGDAATLVHVCFPSAWRPERALGAGFREIHAPVPGFADADAFASAMLAAMIERGPWLRFVWTLCGDDALDHHPECGHRVPWESARRGWLRVERQLTVPFPRQDSALFLIRTSLRPFDALCPDERAVLRQAICRMPEPIRRYKGIAGHEGRILRLLAAA